ncbi:MAG: hypothetical protein EHM42_06205 [Planctomycetaceae bacterium]|nr:MAG: hypothetical protein EHM42_06205 [Planctomycetaceae bacterium]
MWSFPLGTIFGAQLRISWFLPLVLLWFFQQFGMAVGLLVGGCLFASVLAHEIGHVLAARSLGLKADAILLWPLGGLAAIEPTSIARVDFLVAAAGPLVNLGLCAGLLPLVALQGAGWPAVLNPLVIEVSPTLAERGFPAIEVCEVLFALNWLLLLVNLIPALPLDGGRMLRAFLSSRFPGEQAQEWSIRIAFGGGIVVCLAAMLFLDNTVLLGLGFLILLGAVLESVQMRLGDRRDDSFLGYDFSQGYTSLEQAREFEGTGKSSSVVERWLEQRRASKRERETLEQEVAEEQLDSLLAKVHEQGLSSLSLTERRLLEQVSERYRARSKPST